MSIYNKLESIYNFRINSLEDLEQVIEHSENNEQYKEKISKIMDIKYVDSIEKIQNCLNIGDLFKNVYYKSLGLTTCPTVVNGIDHYQALLSHSIPVCISLTPLFIQSFKCHQKALEHYSLNQRESAIAAMAETGEVAKNIANEYENLSKKFTSLKDEGSQTTVALTNDQVVVCTKKRELKEGERLVKESFLEASDSSLDSAIVASFKIHAALLNVRTFWCSAKIHSQALADPDLANATMIEAIECEDSGRFDKFFEESENVLNDIKISDPKEEKNLLEVINSMKTGRNNALIPHPLHSGRRIELMESKGIEAEFEKSYLKWLNLAKINQTMITSIREAMIGVAENQHDILQIERDPLAIALHKATLNSQN